jgi:hypothetical protein
MFTLEIAGKPIAITDASEVDAREVLESETFKQDLMHIESDGAPLWDGLHPVCSSGYPGRDRAFETTLWPKGRRWTKPHR